MPSNWNDKVAWERPSPQRDLRADIIEQMHAVYLQMVGRFDDEFVYDDERQIRLEAMLLDLQRQHSEIIDNDT